LWDSPAKDQTMKASSDPAPKESPTKEAFKINSTDREDRGEASGAGEGMEVEFTQPDLDASAALMKSLFTQKEIDAAMGTTSAAPTSFRMKFYTKLPESDKWEFANECA
jgi:hypothetical protein